MSGLRLDRLTGTICSDSFILTFDEILQKTETEVSLVMLDIDNFDRVNKEFGHDEGDLVLVHLAEHLKNSVDDKSLVFRYYGDMFAIVMEDTEKESAFLQMEAIRQTYRYKDLVNEKDPEDIVRLSFSAGISTYQIDGDRIADLVRKAEGALYRAKVSGRNKISLAREEKMLTKTTHYTYEQLQRLSELAKKEQVGEAVLLREALDNLLRKYDEAKNHSTQQQ